MEKGSLVLPSKYLMKKIPVVLSAGIRFQPAPPEEGEIFVVDSIFEFNYGGQSIPCVGIDGLKAFRSDGEELHFMARHWVEIQPPMEVSIENLIEELVY